MFRLVSRARFQEQSSATENLFVHELSETVKLSLKLWLVYFGELAQQIKNNDNNDSSVNIHLDLSEFTVDVIHTMDQFLLAGELAKTQGLDEFISLFEFLGCQVKLKKHIFQILPGKILRKAIIYQDSDVVFVLNRSNSTSREINLVVMQPK